MKEGICGQGLTNASKTRFVNGNLYEILIKKKPLIILKEGDRKIAIFLVIINFLYIFFKCFLSSIVFLFVQHYIK